MIPAADHAWDVRPRLPLAGLHPAARLGAGGLAVLSALLLPWPALPPLAMALAGLLRAAGARPGALGRQVVVWLPVAALVLAAHTVSATDTAPLWHPSWTGLGRGVVTLVRLALMLAATALTARLLPLPALMAAAAWYLRPLRPLGVDTRHLGVTLAVALGTAPRVHAEADRIGACLRLRRGSGRRRRGLDLRGRLLVIPPLMESLARRAESLPLALAGRLPAGPAHPPPLPVWQALALLFWAVALVLTVVERFNPAGAS